jgi:hypothetical protein
MPTPVTNFAKVTVSTGYGSGDTSVVLTTGHGSRLESTFPYPLTWWNATDYSDPADDPNREIVLVTNRVSDTLTLTRAAEGTSASTKNTASKTYKMVEGITKAMWDALGLFLIQQQVVASVASVDFTTGIDATYDEYLVTLTDIIPSTDGADLWMRVSQDGGSTFKAGASDYDHVRNSTDTSPANTPVGSTGAAQINLTSNLSNVGNRTLSGEVRFFNLAGTAKHKPCTFHTVHVSSAPIFKSVTGAGQFTLNTSAVNGFQFLMSSGNIASGIFTLYGIRKA